MSYTERGTDALSQGTVLLTNFVPPYILPLYKSLQGSIDKFQILISAKADPAKRWPIEWSGLNVRIQRSLNLPFSWNHPQGFSEKASIHIPWDTLLLLNRFKPRVIL